MRRPKKEIQLTSYDELLGLEESPEKSMNQVVEIELEKLYPFKNHPFHVSDDEKMAETVESIKNYGVLNPALVRPRSEGGYELISGHRRKRGCELCGKTTMPVLVRNYTDDEAVIIMVDSNIQRENILPSEKAHAYKMKYDAMKHQGSKGEKYTAVRKGKKILPSTEGRELVNVMPAYLKSAAMTAEWENQLLMMEKGQITDTQFMGEITSLVGKILSVCREIPETERRRFQKAREVIGKCPVCGSDVYEGKQNFYCSNRQCEFALWKENRFLGSMEKTLDKKMAVELLDKACTHVKGLYSRKKDIKFDADLLLTLEDGKPRFHLEFPKKKKK